MISLVFTADGIGSQHGAFGSSSERSSKALTAACERRSLSACPSTSLTRLSSNQEDQLAELALADNLVRSAAPRDWPA